MQNSSLLIYGVFAALGAATISMTSGTKHVFLCFLLTFWILGASIIHQPTFFLPLKALGGNVIMKQLLFSLLTANVLWLSITRFRLDGPLLSLPFEKFLYAFLGWLGCVLVHHYSQGELGGRELLGVSESYLEVLIVYVSLKRFGDTEMLHALGKAIIAVAAISSLVALFQCLGRSDFLLVGNARTAFAGLFRGNGLYDSEYLHSYTAATALLIVLLFVRSWKLRAALTPLLIVGIIVSFHRMSWIVTGILILLYLVYTKGIHAARRTFIVITCLLVLFLLVAQFSSILQNFEKSDAYQSRISEDTMSGRFKPYSMVLDLFDKVMVWGVGTKESSLYFYGMLSTGAGLEWARGRGGIHNVYLEILFLYGAPLLVLFLLLLGSMLHTWRNPLRYQSRFFLFPFGFVVMYCVLNLSNTLPLSGDLGMIFAIVNGAGAYVAGRDLSLSPAHLSLC